MVLAKAHHHLEEDAGQKLSEINISLKQRRHQPIPVQGQWLASVVRGHLAYYAVPGNTDAVAAFRTQVGRLWFKALRRRSQRNRLNCRPPARWDHLEVSSASSMGPPFRQ